MNMAWLTDGNRVHKLCASMTSPASSHNTVVIPSRDSLGQNLAQAVVVSPMTSSVEQVSTGFFRHAFQSYVASVMVYLVPLELVQVVQGLIDTVDELLPLDRQPKRAPNLPPTP